MVEQQFPVVTGVDDDRVVEQAECGAAVDDASEFVVHLCHARVIAGDDGTHFLRRTCGVLPRRNSGVAPVFPPIVAVGGQGHGVRIEQIEVFPVHAPRLVRFLETDVEEKRLPGFRAVFEKSERPVGDQMVEHAFLVSDERLEAVLVEGVVAYLQVRGCARIALRVDFTVGQVAIGREFAVAPVDVAALDITVMHARCLRVDAQFPHVAAKVPAARLFAVHMHLADGSGAVAGGAEVVGHGPDVPAHAGKTG